MTFFVIIRLLTFRFRNKGIKQFKRQISKREQKAKGLCSALHKIK